MDIAYSVREIAPSLYTLFMILLFLNLMIIKMEFQQYKSTTMMVVAPHMVVRPRK